MNKSNLSGSLYSCAELIKKYIGDIDLIDKFRPDKVSIKTVLKNPFSLFFLVYLFARMQQFAFNVFGRNFDWERTPIVARYYANRIEKKVNTGGYDFLLAPRGSICIAYLKTEIPIIYETDTTFQSMVNYYEEFKNLAPLAIRYGNKLEKMALQKAAKIVTTSKWAMDAMINYYGIEKSKITVIAPQLFLKDIPAKNEVLAIDKKREVCEVLFIGVDWKRKGGDIALEAIKWLNQQKIHVRLTTVGCSPPPLDDVAKGLVVKIGFLNKNSEFGSQKFKELLLNSHFLLVPTRADACGRVFTEASAYGLPIISTNTGGISSTVHNYENGVLLDYDVNPEEYGKIMKEIWENENRYNLLRVKTREAFDNRLSPRIWKESFYRIIGKIKRTIE